MKVLAFILSSFIYIFALAQAPVDISFNQAGTYSYTVNAGFTANITVEAWGGGGGINGGAASRGGGGGGGYSANTYDVGPGTYPILVGDGGGSNETGESSSYNFNGTLVEATGGSPGLGSGGGVGGIGNTANGGAGGVRVNGGGGGGGGAAACADGSDGLAGADAVGSVGGAGGVGCMVNPGNDGSGGAGGDSSLPGGNGLIPGGGAGGKGNAAPSNGNGARGRVRVTVNTVLPVVLSEFDARIEDNNAILTWTTEGEVNNDYFVIERSNDGKSFKEIGMVDGNGNTSQSITYQSLDKTPKIGYSYYRLRQVDYDGKFAYSPTKSVRFQPSGDIVNLTYKGNNLNYTSTYEDFTISIFNVNGIMIETFEVNGQGELSLETYNNGIYFAKISGTAVEHQIFKMIKF